MMIYKILLPREWADFEAAGRFDGSSFDRSSGFIHFSSREQVGGTARRFFADEPELVVVAVDAGAMGESLRWEPASDGGTFPHVYGSLSLGVVLAVYHVAGAQTVDEALPPE
jgi:uncharacterized protein (DUF952 family)